MNSAAYTCPITDVYRSYGILSNVDVISEVSAASLALAASRWYTRAYCFDDAPPPRRDREPTRDRKARNADESSVYQETRAEVQPHAWDRGAEEERPHDRAASRDFAGNADGTIGASR